MEAYRNTNLEVDLKSLTYNHQVFTNSTNKTLFAIVKADAYGLGATAISKHLISLGTNNFGVATLDEAVELRNNGISANILVMGYVPVKFVSVAKDLDIALTVISNDWAKELSNSKVKNLKLHLKINTTMNRLGHNDLNDTKASLKLLKDNHNIEGIFTHYACKDLEIIKKDFSKFKEIVKALNYNFKWVHAANSYASLKFKEDFTNSIRVGIGLYGGMTSFGLKNVATLKTEVSLIRSLNKGDTVSYDGNYIAKNNHKIAILTIGYADGISRSDSGNDVFINNKYYPIIGSVCMDQIMVKIDDNINLYDQVEIFGDNISIESIAHKRDTIDYEVLTSISKRVKRVYIK